MRDEVEEFLKRVARMRAEAEAKSRAAPPQRKSAAPQRPEAQSPVMTPPALPARLDYPAAIEAEVVEAELADTADGVARHVTQHLRGTEQIGEHARRLGEEVDQADEKLEAHLHQVFDHRVGQLRTSVTDQAAAAASDAKRTGFTAGAIAGMLLSPDHIRNAMVLGEILRRPSGDDE